MHLYSPVRLVIAGAVTLSACSKAESSDRFPAVSQTADTVRPAAIDACTFLTKEELESALGYTLEPGAAAQGEPSCKFVAKAGGTVTIALPTANVTEADFYAWQRMAGANAESVSGIGDAAYFWGPRLYVRVGTRTFTISVADRDLTPDLRAALTRLGQSGAAKIR